MLRVGQILDGLIHDVPRPYLSADAQIVHDKVFERAVVTLQRGDNLTQPVGTATAAADTVISNSYLQKFFKLKTMLRNGEKLQRSMNQQLTLVQRKIFASACLAERNLL